MKKILAMMISLVLLFAVAAPALAAPSIGELTIDVEEIEPLTELPEGWHIEVLEPTNMAGMEPDIAKIFLDANDAAIPTTVEDVIKQVLLLGVDSENQEQVLEKNRPVLDALTGFDFVTPIHPVVLTNNTEYRYTWEGKDIPAEVKLKVPAMQGVETVDGYLVMVVNPDTHEFKFVPLKDTDFDTATGTVVFKLPFIGAMTLIQGGQDADMSALIPSSGIDTDLPEEYEAWWIEVRPTEDVREEDLQPDASPIIKANNYQHYNETPAMFLQEMVTNAPGDSSPIMELLKKNEFAAKVLQVVLTNGIIDKITMDGVSIPVTVKIPFEALKGLENLDNFLFLLINVEQDSYFVMDLKDAAEETADGIIHCLEKYDAETGTVSIHLPTLGFLALIQQ